MHDSALQFLTGVLGTDGARALARTADREPALEPLLVPRAALAWLRDRPDFEGLIPGQRNSYLSFQKSEQGYAGVVSLSETNYEFLAASPEHLAAAIALAVGVDPALRHPVRDLTLVRLGKSIDALARAHELAKALPKAIAGKPGCKGCGKRATVEAYDYGDGVASHWCDSCRNKVKSGWSLQDIQTGLGGASGRSPYAGLQPARAESVKPGAVFYSTLHTGEQVPHQVTSAEIRMLRSGGGVRDDPHVYIKPHDKPLDAGGWYPLRALFEKAPVAKTELPGRTHQPTAQQEPEGPAAPQKQPQMTKPKLPKPPKMPGLRVGKSEQENPCPSCGGVQFAGNVFRGCVCFRELSKHVKTTVYGDGVVLEFGAGFPAPALRLLRKALLP